MQKIIDISLPIKSDMPVYPGTSETKLHKVKSGSGSSVLTEIFLTSHAGTHIDAPSHAIKGALHLESLNLSLFLGPCRVIDLTFVKDAIKKADLQPKNILPNERILLKTNNSLRGFKQFYEDYIYLSPEAAKFLASKKVILVGIDALSIKKKGEKDNTSHIALLSLKIPILEGINLSEATEGEYDLLALPVALTEADGAPTRAILISKGGLVSQSKENLQEFKLYTDGGSRGNPGSSASAYVICSMDGTVIEKKGFYLGISTNNKAEYDGLIRALSRLKEMSADKVNVFMDSELIVKQLQGSYKVKNPELIILHQKVKNLSGFFNNISFNHIPRRLNQEADREVNRILDESSK